MSAPLDDPEIQRRYREWPIFKYDPIAPTEANPHYNNCLGFHQSRAQVRLILGANRSSKTETMMAEVAAVALGAPYPWWFNWSQDLPPPLTIWIVIQAFPKNPSEDARIKKLYIGENYLTRDRRWMFKGPLIPPEMVKWHNADWTEVLLHNGNTLSIKSNEQKQSAFASNQVDLICVDEPTESNKWRELISRMVAVPHGRLIHGLTDVTDTTEYLDQMLESDDPDLPFEKFHFTTAGNPHTDRKHAETTFKLQTREQRMITEHGMRPADLARCYPNVGRWIDPDSGREIKNEDGESGNWIKPFKIPPSWTRYVVHDPGVNVAAAVWFAVEPGKQNIFAYRCVHIKNPGGNYQWVIDTIHRANQGDEIAVWYMDPKAAKFKARSYVYAAKESAKVIYQRHSNQYGIQWREAPPQVEGAWRDNRIRILSGYLNPLETMIPMMYFFDVKDGIDPNRGLEGMPALKYEFKKYRWDRTGARPKPVGPNDAIYCCEVAALIPLRDRGKVASGSWPRIMRRDPVEEFMNGSKPMNWREEP